MQTLELTIPVSPAMQLRDTAPAELIRKIRAGVRWWLPNPESRAVSGTGLRELTVDWWGIVNGAVLRIRAGYRWDGASVPRLGWSIVGPPFDSRHEVGGLVHDVLYGAEACDRATADQVLHDIIERTRGFRHGWRGWRQKLHANLFRAAVRAGGWWVQLWRSKRNVAKQRRQIEWWSEPALLLMQFACA